MLKATITLTGRTSDELGYALDVVKRQLEEGFTSGKQTTMEGGFQYSVEGEEEED